MAELKPCPFCGETASETMDEPILFGCSRCDVWEVIPEDWNERSLPAALDVVITAVREGRVPHDAAGQAFKMPWRLGFIGMLEAMKPEVG